MAPAARKPARRKKEGEGPAAKESKAAQDAARARGVLREKLVRKERELQGRLDGMKRRRDKNPEKDETLAEERERRKVEEGVAKAKLQIKGIDTGVSEIVQFSILRGVFTLASMEEPLRELWLDLRAHDGPANKLFTPPRYLAGPHGARATFSVAHAAAVTHDIGILRACVVDAVCSDPPEQLETGKEQSASATTVLERWFDAERGQGNTPLHLACMHCGPLLPGYKAYQTTCAYLIEAMPFEALVQANNNGDTALTLAAGNGASPVLEQLCARGMPIRARDVFLAARGGFASSCHLLVRALADARQAQEDHAEVLAHVESTFPHVVVESASREEMPLEAYEALMQLITGELGIAVDARDSSGQTPLHVACKEQSVDPIAVDLLKRGADASANDYAGRQPADYLVRLDKAALRHMFAFFATHPPADE